MSDLASNKGDNGRTLVCKQIISQKYEGKHIRVPANEEVHVWCETFDVAKGDSLRVSI